VGGEKRAHDKALDHPDQRHLAGHTRARAPQERIRSFFILMRNLGGAFGLAGLTTVLNDRTDLHLARLHEAITWSRVPAMEALNQLTQRFQSFGSDAQAMALKQLMQITHRQGVVTAFSDVFLLLTFLFGGLAIAAMPVRQPSPGAAAPAH
jgi:DHA2 family multidrug resistance protein